MLQDQTKMDYAIAVKAQKAAVEASRKLASSIRQEMIRLAYSNLSSETASIYEAALTEVTVKDGEVFFTLSGWLANALEQGCDPFDMKPGMLASPKVKISKKGIPYLRVPIRVANSPVIIRTVTANSPPGSWVHPGLVARHFFEMATYALK